MNKFKFSNYKLPHMKSAFLKETKEVQPEINRNFPRLENRVPEGEGRYNAAFNNNHVVGSSGGNPEDFKYKYRDSVAESIKDPKLASFIKDLDVIDNPEYGSYTKKLNPDSEVFGKYNFSDQSIEPVRSNEYDFFVKHRTPESDQLAYNIMDLNDQMNEARKNRDSDKIREIADKSKNLQSVIKNAGRVMEEGGKSEYLEDKMKFRGEL